MDAKKTLLELARRRDLANHLCADCDTPHPQWASVSFAVFLCLHCAGVHRGFGVHISFVRSIAMDAWHPDQLRRMQLGGNAPFKAFLGDTDAMDTHARYHSWAATQYRDKLDHALAGTPWSPSSPPFPSPALGLRTSRASARANEASPGQANAAERPPSQGGRYQGFGNTSSPPLQDNPLSKGWSLLSTAVAGASRVVNDHVIQPAMDPALHASVRGYVSEAHKRAQLAGHSANEWSKSQLGVDVADHVTGIVGAVKDSVGAGPPASGYTSLPTHDTDLVAAGEAKKDDEWDEWQDF